MSYCKTVVSNNHFILLTILWIRNSENLGWAVDVWLSGHRMRQLGLKIPYSGRFISSCLQAVAPWGLSLLVPPWPSLPVPFLPRTPCHLLLLYPPGLSCLQQDSSPVPCPASYMAWLPEQGLGCSGRPGGQQGCGYFCSVARSGHGPAGIRRGGQWDSRSVWGPVGHITEGPVRAICGARSLPGPEFG